jgi:3-dehydroquinate synthetase
VTSIDVLGYPIIVGSGLFGHLAGLVNEHARAHRYAIITDVNVAPHYLAAVRDALASDLGPDASDRIHTVVIPAGE